RQPRARYKQLLAHAHAAIARDDTIAANKHLVCCEIIKFHAAVGPRRHREVLPAQTIASRKFAADLPLVLHVGAVLPTAERVTIGSLGHKVISTQRIGSAEQEGR